MPGTLTIARRFNGPAQSGNGGYVCGMLAREIGGASEVTLLAPPPLDTPLEIERADTLVRLSQDGDLIAEARPIAFALVAPPAPSLEQAEAARARYRGLRNHRYPTCFVCGPERAPQNSGLKIYTGSVTDTHIVAATWTPSADLADSDGRVAPEFIHAALDCPSYWGLPRAGDLMALLARMSADIVSERPPVGEPLIVIGWALGSDGRKHRGASALYRADGALIASAEALWIEPRS